jgi:hypothetical protein
MKILYIYEILYFGFLRHTYIAQLCRTAACVPLISLSPPSGCEDETIRKPQKIFSQILVIGNLTFVNHYKRWLRFDKSKEHFTQRSTRLFVRFSTFVHESEIQFARNLLSTYYGHMNLGTNFPNVS